MIKNTRIENPKYRLFAKDRLCTVNIPNVCNRDPKTSVSAHFNFEGGCMGGKTHDHSSGISCSSCHDVIDGRVNYKWSNPDEKYLYMARSMVRTLTLAIKEGVKI
jgi:hypothetical protein